MAKRDVEVKFSLVDGISKGLGKIETELEQVTNKILKFTPAAIAAGAAIGAVALGATFSEGLQAAAAFEASLDKIGAKAQITGEELQSLGADIRRIAQDAGKTGAEGAAGFEKLQSEGFKTADALKALPAALDFATASAQGTTEAVGSLADNLDAFGLGAESFAHAADVISAGALKGGVGVGDLQKALQAVGPTAQALNLSLEQTTALLATLGQNGIEGGKAGKALATIFDQLQTPSSKFREELAKIGISSTDFNEVLQRLRTTSLDTTGVFTSLGINGTASLRALAKDGGASAKALATELANVQGTTSKLAAAIQGNLLGAFTKLKEAIDAAGASFLEPILAPIAAELDLLRAKINEFAASPEFASLRDAFADAFVNGIEAVRNYIAAFDFKEAVAALESFLKSASEVFQVVAENAERFASSAGVAIDSVRLAINALQAATALATQAIAKNFEIMLTPLSLVSQRAADARFEFEQLGKIAGGEVRTQMSDLDDAASSLAENLSGVAGASREFAKSGEDVTRIIGSTADAAKKATAAHAQYAEVTARLKAANDEAAASAERARTGLDSLGNVIPVVNQKLTETEQKAVNAALGLDKLGKVIPIVTAAAAAADKALEKSTSDEKARIQSNIDARKQQVAAIKEVTDASIEAADAQQDAQAAIAADLGLSDKVLQGLTEGLTNVTRDLALLRGVSEDVVRDSLVGSLKGATDTMGGLNDALQRGREEIEKLGGAGKLAELNADLERTAELARTIGQRSREAAESLAGIGASLQDELDQLEGNQAAIEERRFQEQISRIRQLALEAGVSADRELQAATRIHEAKLQQIREQAQARIDAETGADATIATRRAGGALSTAAPTAPNAQNFGNRPTQETTVNVTFNTPDIIGDIRIDAVARQLVPALKRLGLSIR